MAYGNKKPLVVGFDKHDKDLIVEAASKNKCSQAEIVRRIIKQHFSKKCD